MKKVLITSLGTGSKLREDSAPNYRYSIYEKNGSCFFTPYIFESLVISEKYNKVILIGTNSSGWGELIMYTTIEDSIESTQLLDRIIENNGTDKVAEVLKSEANLHLEKYFKKKYSIDTEFSFQIMEFGNTETSITNNLESFIEFSKEIFTDSKEEILVDLDITHSFRSLPFFQQTMLNYLKEYNSKENIVLNDIFYGMLEGKNPDRKVIDHLKKSNNVILDCESLLFDKERDVTDIVNLRILNSINEWVVAVNNFREYGRAERLIKLLSDYSYFRGGDLKEIINNIIINIEKIAFFLQTNSLNNLNEPIVKFNTLINTVKIKSKDNFLNLIIDLLSEFNNDLYGNSGVLRFKSTERESFKIQYKAAQLYKKHKNYVSMIGAIFESVISLAMEQESNDFLERNEFKKNYTRMSSSTNLIDRLDYIKSPIDTKLSYFLYAIDRLRNNIYHLSSSHKKESNEFLKKFKIVFNIQYTNEAKTFEKIFSVYEELISEYLQSKDN